MEKSGLHVVRGVGHRPPPEGADLTPLWEAIWMAWEVWNGAEPDELRKEVADEIAAEPDKAWLWLDYRATTRVVRTWLETTGYGYLCCWCRLLYEGKPAAMTAGGLPLCEDCQDLA